MVQAFSAVLLAVCCAFVSAHAESLYDADSFLSLGSDRKASRVGDVITILVVENSSATSSAETSSGRRSTTGAEFSLSRRPTTSMGLEVEGDFDGGGQTQRSGRLLAQMTASVVGLTPNGDLLVSGDQVLTVNDEEQKIQVKGRVRPADIASGNVVLSTRLADAQITYLGDGELAGRQRPAWWTRFLNWLGF